MSAQHSALVFFFFFSTRTLFLRWGQPWRVGGEKAECLLIEVREGEEKCIYAAPHADSQAVLCFLFSNSQRDSLMNYKWINEFFPPVSPTSLLLTDRHRLPPHARPHRARMRGIFHTQAVASLLWAEADGWGGFTLPADRRGPCRQRTAFNPWR